MKTHFVLLIFSISLWGVAISLTLLGMFDKTFSIHRNLKLLMHFLIICICTIAAILASRKKEVVENTSDDFYGISLRPFFTNYSKIAMTPFIISTLIIISLFLTGFTDHIIISVSWMIFTSISILIFSKLRVLQ